MKKLPTNCPNCGAPLDSDGYCSYCNTKIRYANEVEYRTFLYNGHIRDILPTEILFKFKADDGTMLILPFIGKPENIEITYDDTCCIDYYGNTVAKFHSTPLIKFDFVGNIKPQPLGTVTTH